MHSERAIEILRRLQPGLEARGIAHAAVFGSVARNEAGARSDIDIVVTPRRDSRLDLIDLGGVQSLLDDGFAGLDVDLVVEPVGKPALLGAIERDRVRAF